MVKFEELLINETCYQPTWRAMEWYLDRVFRTATCMHQKTGLPRSGELCTTTPGGFLEDDRTGLPHDSFNFPARMSVELAHADGDGRLSLRH